MKKENNNQNQSTQIIATVLAIAILIVAVVGISFAAFTYTKAGEKQNTITTGTITMVYTEDSNGVYITDAMPLSDTLGRQITADDANGAGKITENKPINENNEGNGVFEFSVAANISGTMTINYDVMAKKDTEASTLGDEYAKIYVEKSEGNKDSYSAVRPDEKTGTVATYDTLPEASSASTSAGKAAANSKVLATGTFNGERTDYFKLRMWLAEEYGSDDAKGEIFGTSKTFKITVDVYGEAASGE